MNAAQIFAKYRFDFFKIVILVISSFYFLGIAFNPSKWSFLDYVNLLIHEGGHLVFRIFGSEFLSVAGGSIMQVLMPLAFVVYFFRTGQKFSASLTLFWVGESMINVSVYMADAVVMQLPLLGGDGVIHDWNYLLSNMGLLSSTSGLALVVRGLGVIVIIAAAVSGFLNSRKVEISNSPLPVVIVEGQDVNKL